MDRLSKDFHNRSYAKLRNMESILTGVRKKQAGSDVCLMKNDSLLSIILPQLLPLQGRDELVGSGETPSFQRRWCHRLDCVDLLHRISS